jgi:hypothetical protein
MNRTVLPAVLAACSLAAAPSRAAASSPAVPPTATTHVSGPATHGNLAVFLIHGPAAPSAPEYLTLQEAMARKLVVVHETGNVNELSVENLSPQVAVFIHAGDIVKGGRQDRTIPQDVLLPPASGRVPLASFCVEHGRWSARGSESAAAFGSANDMLVGSGLKLASRKAADQAQVWRQVARAQEALSVGAGAPVAAPESPTSLQLTLQSPRVQQSAEAYVKALTGAPAGKPDVIGCAFVVNGAIRSAELYDSPELFGKMWPRLLKSAAIEAISTTESQPCTLKVQDVAAFLAAPVGATPETRDLSEREKLRTLETERVMVFETLDRKRKDSLVHRSWVAK